MVDPLFGNLGNMNQAFLSRCKLKESAKLFNADNFSGKDLTCLKFGCDNTNILYCLSIIA